LFQISETPIVVKVADQFGTMEVRSITKDLITMSNNGSIGLDKNTESILLGNIKLKIADDDNLRFYPKIDYIISDVTAIKRGDVSGNNTVNIVDALFIAQHTVGLRTIIGTQALAADVNGDSAVNIVDALFVAQAVAGLRILV